ncbi:MAG TPA: hypothetical protein PLB43_06305 [Prolixibacteraceae bacterium]|nr:hypothetical protein [Prolixibacteraceae bacterium]HOS00244.1 hypothetical protein [Prolixibacteraceae bacterium]HPL45685.1 hypothetical protein [Prolixibacteraceae bacterium]
MISEEPVYIAELAVIVAVVLFQVVHTFRVYLNIRSLRSVFRDLLLVRNGYVERRYLGNSDLILANTVYLSPGEDPPSEAAYARITLTETESKHEILLRIKMALNTYLLNNYGASVNFGIIRDLVDREVDSKDEEISQSLPTPLYLGLAATMVGFIFGLFAMPDIDGHNFTQGINTLIDGVKLAMTASLSGLLCTTVLSSFFYKRAKAETLRRKNAQLSYLQARLLPELIRAEDTGVSGLKASLDHFSREATVIVGKVHEAAEITSRNLYHQQGIISRLERMNVTRVSKANLELFDRLEGSVEALQHFSQYLSGIEAIAANLKEFASSTVRVDAIAGEVNTTLAQSRELTRFLTAHFDRIEQAGSAALRAVDLTESHFGEAIGTLRERTQNSIQTLYALSDQTDSALREAFGKVVEELKSVTANHLNEFMAAYRNAVPRFEQLKNLESLGSLQNTIDGRAAEMIRKTETSNQEVLESLRELTFALTGKSPLKRPAGKWWEKAEILLRILALLGIITVTAGIVLYYFNLL